MEKVLKIDGKDIRFKATAATLLRYKAEMNREFLADCAALTQSVTIEENGEAVVADASRLNLDLAFGIAWAMAKTADRSVPDMLTWLDEFEEFDVSAVFAELFPMLNGFLKVDAKNA